MAVPRGTCFHESAHAVLSLVYGLRVFEIEVREDGYGRVLVSWPDDLDEERAICAMSGIIAAKRSMCDWARFEDLQIENPSDYAKMETLVWSPYKQRCLFGQARELVEKKWPEIEELAEVLRTNPKLDESFIASWWASKSKREEVHK